VGRHMQGMGHVGSNLPVGVHNLSGISPAAIGIGCVNGVMDSPRMGRLGFPGGTQYLLRLIVQGLPIVGGKRQRQA
jgi:hypothetical protein